MWDLPGPGLEPMSPALASGFLTTALPGKAVLSVLKVPSVYSRLQQMSKYTKNSGSPFSAAGEGVTNMGQENVLGLRLGLGFEVSV